MSTPMSLDILQETRRQVEICNACRYCEGYCAVFPAITRDRAFADGDLTQLANLCHNCRGCYYACQYTAPHEFDLNLPAVLAQVRTDSWERLAWPGPVARLFQRSGVALAAAMVLGLAVIFWIMQVWQPSGGEGFYAYLAHTVMVAIFLPAFLFPLVAIALSLRAYWREMNGAWPRISQITQALRDAGRMRNLDGGQGQGCNFESGDRYTNARRHAHQAVMYGFLLCFASTSVATFMHYFLNMPAPYGLFSLPKLLGISGGLLLVVGCIGLAVLKTKADPDLGDRRVWGGEMGFILLLGFVGLSGLVLYAATGVPALVPVLLALHLGSVLSFFLLMPYSKMVHGFFRLAALVRDVQIQQGHHGRVPAAALKETRA